MAQRRTSQCPRRRPLPHLYPPRTIPNSHLSSTQWITLRVYPAFPALAARAGRAVCPSEHSVFKLQTFTQLAEANLANVRFIPVTLRVMPTLPEPALSPGSTTFGRSIDIDCVNDP